jgi:hypothetical protein
MVVVPSVKYHLPKLGEAFRDEEYAYTTQRLAEAWGAPPFLIEIDFSPTLAGDALADDRAQILRWLREVPARVRAASPVPTRIAVKLMNARFDDAFQCEMMHAWERFAGVLQSDVDVGRGIAWGLDQPAEI